MNNFSIVTVFGIITKGIIMYNPILVKEEEIF